MKMLQKTLACFLALAMILCMAPFTASAAVQTGGTIYGDDGPYTAPCVEDGYFVVTPNVGSAFHDYGGSGTDVLLLGGEYDGRIYFTVTGEADVTVKACSHFYDTTTELYLEELTEGTIDNYEFCDVVITGNEWDSSQLEVTWTISDLGPGIYYIHSESDPVAITQISVSESTNAPHTHVLEDVVDKAPTCTQGGNGHIVCSCGIVAQAVNYPITGHNYEVIRTVAPTCTVQGYTTYSCSGCGNITTGNDVPALGHSYNADDVCTTCGLHNPATCEHAYSSVVTAPTCIDKGYTTYTCPNCGHSYEDNYVKALTYGEYVYRFDAYDELYGSNALPSNVGTDGFFTISGIANEDSSAYNSGYIVLDREGTRSIEFTVDAIDVAVCIVASCPSGGQGIFEFDGNTEYVYGSEGKMVFEYSLIDVGDRTFKLQAIQDDEEYGDVRIHSITINVTSVTPHTYETVVKAPTCAEVGGTVHTCSVCGDSYITNEVAALGHSYSSVVTAPTCTKQGYTTYTCTVCGNSYVADYVNALGHNYVDGICAGCGRHQCAVDTTYTFNAPDLTAAADSEAIPDGSYVGTNDYFQITGTVKKRVSSNIVKYVELLKNEGGKFSFEVTGVANVTVKACSTSKTNTSVVALMDANGNVITSDLGGIVEVTGTSGIAVTYTDLPAGTYYIVSPTENVYKRNTRVISITVVESGPSVVHSYESVTVDATCTEDGSITYTCSVCGDSYSESIGAKGHSYEAVVTAPTCTEGGYTTYTCECGDSYTADEVEALGHSYEAVVTAPTCTEGGYTTYTCTACGDSYVADYTDALGHSFENGTCGVCGAADPDYVAPEAPEAPAGGIHKDENGDYYYYVNGEIATDFNGLVDNWYIENGKIQFTYNGLVTVDGERYYVKGGKVQDVDGLMKLEGTWLYLVDGKVDTQYAGLVAINGMLAYVENGEVDFNKKDLVEYNGELYYVKYGLWSSGFSGLYKASNGTWYYVDKGIADVDYTGLAKNDLGWWYMENGQINLKYTGFALYSGSYWYVKNGQVTFSDTGIVTVGSDSWYVKGSQRQDSFSGIYTDFDGKQWTIQSGKVV